MSSPRPASASYGSQEPRTSHYPAFTEGLGDEFIAVAELAGLHPDPWQRLVVEKSLLVRPDGELATPEVGICLPRQNGKGGVLEILELGRLFVLESPLTLHSAHLFKTSKEAYLRIRSLIQNTPALDRRVLRYSNTNGDEGIILKNGCRLHFVARSGGSGRGLSGNCVMLDEAMYLPAMVMSALIPTISAKRYGQIVYAGSAVDQTTMADGQTFARVRKRGSEGSSDRLAYFEWSLPFDNPDSIPDDVLRDPASAKTVNPAIGIRIAPETVAGELEMLGPRGFAVERLNVGDWPAVDGEDQVFSVEKWNQALDPLSAALDPVVFALDVTPDRRRASITVAGKRPDENYHIEVVEAKPGTEWAVPRLKELTSRHSTVSVIVDGAGQAKSLIPDLEAAGVEVTVMNTDDHTQACGFIFDAVENGTVRHRGQASLNSAVRGAAQRPLNDRWAWSRKSSGVDITPLVGCTLALWGAATLSAGDILVAFA